MGVGVEFGKEKQHPPFSINFNDGIGILHVYFGNSYVTEFRQNIIHTWYELLSIYGNLIAIVIGGSMVRIDWSELIRFSSECL